MQTCLYSGNYFDNNLNFCRSFLARTIQVFDTSRFVHSLIKMTLYRPFINTAGNIPMVNIFLQVFYTESFLGLLYIEVRSFVNVDGLIQVFQKYGRKYSDGKHIFCRSFISRPFLVFYTSRIFHYCYLSFCCRKIIPVRPFYRRTPGCQISQLLSRVNIM